jgi:pilus assembly protein CpaF
MVTGAERDFIVGRLEARENLIFAGATGSGKTTLLSAVMATVPKSERIITVEDTAELRINHPHVVGLETRQPNIEGAGEVSLHDLVRQSLRMRPDRLVLGECRGAEFGSLLTALNTGHGGVGTTVHASSLEAVPARVEALGMLAGLSSELCARLVVEAFHYVLFLDRTDGVRRVAQIGRLELAPSGEVRVRALGREEIER